MAGFEVQKENEDCVRAMVGMFGGLSGMVNRNIRLVDLMPILDANPDDDLSGLRLIASRMNFDTFSGLKDPRVGEPQVFPEEAKQWLIKTGRVMVEEGALTPLEYIDHLGLAALSIAQGGEPGLMTEAYKVATDNRSPLHDGMIRDIASMMVQQFTGDS